MSNIILSVTTEIAEKKLGVSYSLSNKTAKRLFPFVRLWSVDSDGKMVVDPNPAYTSIDDERVLRIGKIVHPLPKNKRVEQRIVPFAVILEPGQTWSEKLEFASPVREYNPYFLAKTDSLWDEVSVNSIRLCIDYFVDTDELKLHKALSDDSFRLEHLELLKRIQRAESEDIRDEVPALRRTENFERFKG